MRPEKAGDTRKEIPAVQPLCLGELGRGALGLAFKGIGRGEAYLIE